MCKLLPRKVKAASLTAQTNSSLPPPHVFHNGLSLHLFFWLTGSSFPPQRRASSSAGRLSRAFGHRHRRRLRHVPRPRRPPPPPPPSRYRLLLFGCCFPVAFRRGRCRCLIPAGARASSLRPASPRPAGGATAPIRRGCPPPLTKLLARAAARLAWVEATAVGGGVNEGRQDSHGFEGIRPVHHLNTQLP